MAEPFIGEIRIFAGTYAPKGWALCNGYLLSIAQHTALFSILGTNYGGDGKITFGLPNLQGSAPLQAGLGPGLTQRDLGEVGGQQTVTLTNSEVPSHTHAFMGNEAGGDQGGPVGNVTAKAHVGRETIKNMYSATAGTSPKMIDLPGVGGGQAHNNMSPFLAVNFIIALDGIFPPRG